MKQLTKLIALVGLITVLDLFSISDAHGQTTYSFSSIPTTGWSTSGGNQTINNVSWTYSSCNHISVNSSKLQIGSAKNPQTNSWSIQTAISNFGNNVTVLAVSITAYTTATSATYDISVGGASVKSGSLTTSSATYTANDLSATSGDIVVTMTGSSSSKAMYLSNISVTYSSGPVTYTVTYNANDATSGSVPTDATAYTSGATVTVKDNTGYLAKTGNAFSGWNTKADGTGIDRAVGSTFNISDNTTLYAKWTPYTIAAQSNNNSYGTVSLMGSVITGAPKSGYRYANPAYTVSSGSATVVQNGDEFTVTPTSDCTITINFEAIPSHTAHFSVNGTVDNNNDCTVKEGESVTFPSNPAGINGKSFVGWVAEAIDGATDDEPSYVTSATMSTGDVTFYAVFATVNGSGDPVETKAQTLQYDSWTYSGSTTDKTNFRLFHSGSYIESSSFDLSKLSKVIVYGGTYGGGDFNSLSIGDGSNTWKDVTVTGNSNTGNNTYTGGSLLSGTKPLRITCNSGTASSTGVRISKVEIYTNEPTLSYSAYCTTVTAPTQVATPYFSPAAGAVVYGTSVEISCDTDGATIYYTTNGDIPTSSSIAYSAAIDITEEVTINAIAIKDGMDDSNVASAHYTIATPCATPVFSVEAGAVDRGTKVEISTVTDGATIYYTTNGSEPTTSSFSYSSAITVNTAMTLKAIAVKTGCLDSDVASAAYSIVSFASLPFSFDSGKTSIQSITGFDQNGLGNDYANKPYLKFDSTGDYLVLSFNECPGTLSFDISGNSFSGGTFKVQASSDGTSYTDLASYTSLGDPESKSINDIAHSVRYIKWVYTEKSNGNVGLGNINLSKNTTGSEVTLSAKLNNGRYWTTYYNADTRYTLSAGAQAFIMNSDKQLYLLGSNGRVIPKATAVVIISDSDTITLTKSDSSDDVDTHGITNILEGSNNTVAVGGIGGKPYVLGVLYGTIGFYEFKGSAIPAMKAYYVVNE